MDKTEITHLLISWITITLAFSLDSLYLGINKFFTDFSILLIVLGAGFILHELGHRTVAKTFGLIAFYRAWIPGLVLALLLAIATGGRFIFAAPGAVYIGGRPITRRENGLISIAGPAVNIVLGFLFMLLLFSPIKLIQLVGIYGAYTNFILGAFNLIPIPPIDGSKVITWSPAVWLIAISIPSFMLFMVM
jgi:Zn-dependent protease